MNKNILIGVIAVVLIIGGVYLATKRTPATVTENTGNPSQGTQLAGTPPVDDTPSNTNDGTQAVIGVNVSVGAVTITYTNSGFTPSTITVKKGTEVTFVNTGTKSMWVASDEHPSHIEYAGTERRAHCPDTAGVAFDQCATGNSYAFTFNKVGTWDYHNHASAGDEGKVIVTE